MSVMRYLIPAAAAVAAVHAQCSAEATQTIENAVDASALASCTTFSGSIAVATNVPGDLTFPGVEVIEGDLIVQDVANLTSLGANDLTQISGSLVVQNSPGVQSLNFPQLSRVDILRLVDVGGLATLTFTSGLSEVNNVTIMNSVLNTLTGINPEQVGGFEVSNNPYIREVNMEVQRAGGFIVTNNNADLVITLSQLTTASSMDLGNITSVEVPSLSTVNGSFALRGSTGLESFSAPNLTASGDFTFTDNANLNNISAPLLTTITGGFKVAQNPELLMINGLPELEKITGALDLSGNFTEVALPAINDVQGSTNVQSSADIDASCRTLRSASNGDALKGATVVCQSNIERPGSLDQGTPTGASGSNPTGAAVRAEIPVALLGLTGGIFFAMF